MSEHSRCLATCRVLPPAYFDSALAGAARDQSVLAEMLLAGAVPGLLQHLARLSGLTSGPSKGHNFAALHASLHAVSLSTPSSSTGLAALNEDGQQAELNESEAPVTTSPVSAHHVPLLFVRDDLHSLR
jgi:hypothetical protein